MNQQPFNFSWETIHSLTRFSYLEEVKGNAVFKRGDLVSPPPSPPPFLGFFGRGFRDFEISLNRGFQRSSRGVTYRQISLTETTTFRSSIELQRGNKREKKIFLKLEENANLSREWIAVETFRKLSRNFYGFANPCCSDDKTTFFLAAIFFISETWEKFMGAEARKIDLETRASAFPWRGASCRVNDIYTRFDTEGEDAITTSSRA